MHVRATLDLISTPCVRDLSRRRCTFRRHGSKTCFKSHVVSQTGRDRIITVVVDVVISSGRLYQTVVVVVKCRKSGESHLQNHVVRRALRISANEPGRNCLLARDVQGLIVCTAKAVPPTTLEKLLLFSAVQLFVSIGRHRMHDR